MTDLPLFVTRALPGEALERLRGVADLKVSPHDRPLTHAELVEGAAGARVIVSQLLDPIDAAVMDAAPELALICNYAVGYNNVDVEAANARGVAVCNTPDVLTDASADLTFALLLAAARRIPEADRFVRSGAFDGWAPQLLLGTELRGKTLGIVGLGRIGKAVARRAHGFGLRVLYTQRTVLAPEASEGAVYAELDELLAASDFVSLNCPLTPETHHLLDARRLALLGDHAYLINMARGPVVDEAALVSALEAGRLRGAALDVFEREPEVSAGLLERDDVVLCPHLGSATRETRAAMVEIVVENVLDLVAGRSPRTCVNAGALK